MVSVGDTWDSAIEAVRRRLDAIGPIALATVFLPSVFQTALNVYRPGFDRSLASLLVTVLVMVVSFWGALAITALTLDPATTRASATAEASARLPAMLGVFVVLSLAIAALVLPAPLLMVASGDMGALTRSDPMAAMSAGGRLALSVYLLAVLLLFLWLVARLLPLTPVVLRERLGLRAIGRAVTMTRGMSWRLVGAVVLFAIVLSVASGAATYVVGGLLGLALDQRGAAFLGGVAGSVVATIFSVLGYAFSARLYAALRAREAGRVAKDEPLRT